MKAEKYQIVLRGTLDQSWSTFFNGMTLTVGAAGITRLSGEVADRSALHGLLNKIRDLNLSIISLQLLDSDGFTPVECRTCHLKKPLKGRLHP